MIILVEIIALLLLIFMIIAYLVMNLTTYIQQSRCKHDGGVNETQACDAICKLCGKNLGFIGTKENVKRRSE